MHRGVPARRGSRMPGPADRRADRRVVRAVAVTLPAVAAATLLALSSGASAAPTFSSGATAATSAGGTLSARTTALPFKRSTARATTARCAAAADDVQQLPLWSSSFRYASEHKTYPFT